MSKEEKPKSVPFEVKVVNQKEDKKSQYDDTDDFGYDVLGINDEEIEEFEKDDSSSSK